MILLESSKKSKSLMIEDGCEDKIKNKMVPNSKLIKEINIIK